MITNGNVKVNGKKIKQDNNLITIKLKEHQKRMISEMMIKEDSKYRVSSTVNLGVLADKVGSGKSMVILSLIALKPTINSIPSNEAKYKLPNRLSYRLNGYKYTNKCINLKTNLLVVPHSIHHQWLGYLEHFPKIKYYSIKNRKDINGLKINDLKNGIYDLVIVKSTKYNEFMDKLYNKTKYDYDYFEKNYEHNKTMHNQLLNIQKEIRTDYRHIYHQINELFQHTKETIDMEYINSISENIEKLKNFDINKFNDENKKAIVKYIFRVKKGYIFERVIFDEADSVNIPACRDCYGKFVWCITSSIQNLIYPNGCRRYNCIDYESNKDFRGFKNNGYLKRIFQNNYYISYDILFMNYFQELFLKNTNKFIEDSFNLNDPIYHYHECLTPKYLQILHDVALPNIIEALNAGNIKGAIELTNCNKQSEKDITQCILININNDIEKLKEDMTKREDKIKVLTNNIKESKDKIKEYDITIENLDENNNEAIILKGEKEIEKNNLLHSKKQKYSLNKTLKGNKKNLDELTIKRDLIKERISNLDEKNCPVCLQCVTKPMITPCCQNAFCFECLIMSLNHINNNCPLCRTKIAFQDCYMIGNGNKNEKKNKLLNKKEKLMELLNSKKDKRILLFSGFDQTFIELEKLFNENNLKYAYLKGSSGHIKNIINDYKEKKCNILILNAKFFGSGLNLQMTDDIIIYHRMNSDLEKQIIGRGQRLGRTSTLNVHYLCYETEMNK